MDFYQLIAKNFQTSIEAIAFSVDTVAPPIERSVTAMTSALLGDNKIIACGNGSDAALAQLFTSILLGRLENDRPALPAISLNSDASCISAIATSSSFNELYSRQVRALGHRGDILLCISSGEAHSNLIRAVQAAHERNMMVIVLSNINSGEISTLITSDDIVIPVDSPRRTTVTELQLMVIHSICELIDRSLFDSYTENG